MKHSIFILLFSLVFIACSKSNGTNILVGKWTQSRVIEQYTNPYTQATQFDTLTVASVSIEFKNDDTYFTNGVQTGTYSLLNDTAFTLKPSGITYTILSIGNGVLKTRTVSNGEQIKIADPNNPGAFMYANVQFVYIEYQKQ